jgi:hypothetical protein
MANALAARQTLPAESRQRPPWVDRKEGIHMAGWIIDEGAAKLLTLSPVERANFFCWGMISNRLAPQ